MVGDRGAVRGHQPAHHHGRHLPDRPDAPGRDRAGRGDGRRAVQRRIRARRRLRARRSTSTSSATAGRASAMRLGMLEEAVELIREPVAQRQADHARRASTTQWRTRGSTRCRTGAAGADLRVRFRPASRRSSLGGSATDSCRCNRMRRLIEAFRGAGGEWQADAERAAKVCWSAETQARSRVRTVHRLWRKEQLPGELAQVLPTPRHFEQASELVTPEMVASAVPCGDDVERFANAINEFTTAGFDEIYPSRSDRSRTASSSSGPRRWLPTRREPAMTPAPMTSRSSARSPEIWCSSSMPCRTR